MKTVIEEWCNAFGFYNCWEVGCTRNGEYVAWGWFYESHKARDAARFLSTDWAGEFTWMKRRWLWLGLRS